MDILLLIELIEGWATSGSLWYILCVVKMVMQIITWVIQQ